MKSRSILTIAALAFGLVISTSGCASLRKTAAASQPAPTYALAVTVVGGQQPTAQQWADLRARFGQVLAARGLVLVNDIGQADQVIMVELTPNTGESSFGTAVVTGIVPNVLAYASVTQPRGTYPASYPLSYGYMGSFGLGAWPSYTNYNSTIYGYADPFGYANNYNYNTGYYTVTPGTPVTPPDKPSRDRPPHDGPPRWNPNDQTDHPPGTGDHPPRTGDRPPWTDRPTPPTNVVHDHPRPTPPADDNHHWWSGRDGSRPSTPVQPRSEPTYTRSEPTYAASTSSSSSSSSSSYSAPSYSPPSESSSSYSAPSYSPPSESSSSSSGGGSPEGGPSRTIQQN